MTARIFKSTVSTKTLSLAITDNSTAFMTLNSTATMPLTYPFTMVIDPDTVSEEIVTVTGAPTGSVYPITRGGDGTTATTHLIGSVVKHMVTARDLQDAQNHIEATSGGYAITNDGQGATTHSLHGIASGEGAVVGTLKAQSLTNKAISASSISGTITNTGVISGGTISGATISGSTSIADTMTNNGTIVNALTLNNTGTINNNNSINNAGGTISGGIMTPTTLTTAGATLTTPVIASIKNAAGTAYITDTNANFTVGSNDSIINKSYFYQLGTSQSLTNTNNTQSIFGKSITLPETGPDNTLYHIEAKIKLITGTTTHSINFQLNGTGTALPLCDLFIIASDSSGTPLYNTASGISQVTSSASTSNVISNTVYDTAFLFVTGTFAAPKNTILNPSIKFTAGPGGTNTVATSSYIKITPIGPWVTATNTVRGSWA